MATLIGVALLFALTWAAGEWAVAQVHRQRHQAVLPHASPRTDGRNEVAVDVSPRADTEEEVRESVLAALLLSHQIDSATYRRLMGDLVTRYQLNPKGDPHP